MAEITVADNHFDGGKNLTDSVGNNASGLAAILQNLNTSSPEDLASTANGKGASLIGIEDSAGIITATTVEGALAEKLDGRRVANVADANVIGGVPVLHRIDVPAGATGNVDTVLTHKTRVTDVWLVKTAAAGGGAGTIQVLNSANAITDAMSIDINDKAIARALTIDDAYAEIAAAGTLRITRTRTASTSEACTVYVAGLRVA